MKTNLGRNHMMEPSDAAIERDVAELRRLLAGIEGPKEPHPAYWQNFVVRVRNRIDEDGGRRKRRGFSTAWASVGAAAVVTVAVISGIFSPGARVNDDADTAVDAGPVAGAVSSASKADLASHYRAAESEALILSGDDMRMISAIVSDNDNAIFEAMIESDEL